LSLKTLFEPRKQSEDKAIRPRQILIHGHAGVGKTTLCKKIMYDYLHHGSVDDGEAEEYSLFKNE
jgi:GTPase SAR1 family protein